MGKNPRRRWFSSSVDGFRLEDRVALSTTSAMISTDTIPATASPTSPAMIKATFLQATLAQLQSAFKTFGKQVNLAANQAINAVNGGQTQQTALTALSSSINLQTGILEAKVQQISLRLPNGFPNLFSPGGPAAKTPPTTDPSTYVTADIRLQTQIMTMLTTLSSNASPVTSSLQTAVSPTSTLAIANTSIGCQHAMQVYVNTLINNHYVTVVHK